MDDADELTALADALGVEMPPEPTVRVEITGSPEAAAVIAAWITSRAPKYTRSTAEPVEAGHRITMEIVEPRPE